MEPATVSDAAALTGWSARMLRYLEQAGLVVPQRTPAGYRVYALRELNQLRSLRRLRDHHGVGLAEISFAARLRREPHLRAELASWLAGAGVDALDWEQRKHERLLAA